MMKQLFAVVIISFCIGFSCLLHAQTNFSISDTSFIEVCDGFFFDSGGENNGYGPNESWVMTICPTTPGSTISLTFEELQLSEQFSQTGDSLFFYDGISLSADSIGAFGPKESLSSNLTIVSSNDRIPGGNANGCLTVRFKSDNFREGSGWRARVECRLPCQLIRSQLSSSNPSVVDGYIDACIGEPITFNGMGEYPENNIDYEQSDSTSIFEWNFGDGKTAIGRSVEHTYQNPGGYVVQLFITDENLCTNNDRITQRIRVSDKPDFDITGDAPPVTCLGDSITLTASNITPKTGEFVSGATTPTSATELPDGIGTTALDSISIASFTPGQVLENIDDLIGICVNMEHSYLRDLEIELTCPSGESVILHEFEELVIDKPTYLGEQDALNDEGNPGIGYDYCWTPFSTNGTWVEFNKDPNNPPDIILPPGDYESFQPLTNLIGCDLNGIWTIELEDRSSIDNGFLFSWGVEFNPDLFPVIEQFTPTITDFGWQTTNSLITSQTPETITTRTNISGDTKTTFTLQDEYGCTFDTTFITSVLPPTHPLCIPDNCVEDLIDSDEMIICEGAEITLDASPSIISENIPLGFQESPAVSFNKSPVQIGETFVSTLGVNSVLPTTITDPNLTIESICLNATIDASAPYSITVVTPSGNALVLVQEGTVGQFQNACFTPSATLDFTTATSPFTEEYLPVSPFTALTNAMVNGEWQLIISSTGTIDVGAIGGWTVNLIGNPEIQYSWSPAAGISCTDCADPTVSPLMTTTYSVSVSNGYGCSYQDSIRIVVDPDATDLVIDRLDTLGVDCFGNNSGQLTAVVSGGTGDYSYSWNDPLAQTQATASFLEANTVYEVTVRDEVGCTVRDSFALSQPDSLNVNLLSTDIACRGESTGSAEIQVSGGTGPYRFNWSSGDNEQMASDLAVGIYGVTVIDANDCELTNTVTINEPLAALEVTIDQTVQGCFGTQSNEIIATATGGTGTDYSFLWSTGDTIDRLTNIDSISFTVTVTDEAQCARASTFKAQDLEQIDFIFLHVKPSCKGLSNGQIGVDNISGGIGTMPNDYTIDWSTGVSGEIIMNLAGDSTYFATVTDAIGCSRSESFRLQNPGAITFDFDVQGASCFDVADGSIEVINVEGPGLDRRYIYDWSSTDGVFTDSIAQELPAGSYTVTVTDDAGCNSTGTAIVTRPNPIVPNTTVENNRCFGEAMGAIALQPSGGVGGFSFNWSNNIQASNQNGLIAGTYDVTITDSNSCQIVENIVVTEPEIVTIDLETIDPSCFEARDGAISLISVEGGTIPYSYSLDNQNYSPTNNVFGLVDGNYTVFVKDANDCTYTAATELTHPAPLTIQPERSRYQILLGDSSQIEVSAINAQGAITFNFGAPYEGTLSCTDCNNPTASPENTITYQVSAVDEQGCRASELIQVVVEKPRIVEVPSGFTPNGSGASINDQLIVHGRPGTIVTLFQVYDRWGQLLYETTDFEVNDVTTGWDGTFRGKPAEPGVYLWYAEVLYIDGARQALKGETNLIR